MMDLDGTFEWNNSYNEDDDYPFDPPDIPDRPWEPDDDPDDEED